MKVNLRWTLILGLLFSLAVAVMGARTSTMLVSSSCTAHLISQVLMHLRIETPEKYAVQLICALSYLS
jgi:hypothetical protein